MGTIVRCLECDTVYRAAVVTGAEHSKLYQNEAMMETPSYLANKMALDPNVEPMPTFARGLRRLGELTYARSPPRCWLFLRGIYGYCAIGRMEDLWRRTK
jgi:hypothetical protein